VINRYNASEREQADNDLAEGPDMNGMSDRYGVNKGMDMEFFKPIPLSLGIRLAIPHGHGELT
jgi:hypothetical protein